MQPAPDILIVGAGVFGVTAALELTSRGHTVALVDQGSPPFLLAASSDISKVVRMEYGSDAFYMRRAEEAMEGFDAWNESLSRPFYHETGVLMLSREAMQPGGFEHDSWKTLQERGHEPERIDSKLLSDRFPAFDPSMYTDGFFHARGGWVESGSLIQELFQRALAAGVRFTEGMVTDLLLEDGRCLGATLADGSSLEAGHTLLACGAWTTNLLPELKPFFRSSGHPVFHLRPAEPKRFAPPEFCTFTADIAHTGWYGFAVHPSEGVVKIGRHGTGLDVDPVADPREVYESDIQAMWAFVREALPALTEAELVYTRRCLYADTIDADYWLDHHPEYAGLSVASGGSGHGFKMAPILGSLIANRLEGVADDRLERFRWRTDRAAYKSEAARFVG